MQTDVMRFDDAHHLGEPATRPLSGCRSRLAALLLLAMPRHDSSSRTRNGYAGFVRAKALRLRYLASQLLHPALGRVQLPFQG
jgi:hypothetical protein